MYEEEMIMYIEMNNKKRKIIYIYLIYKIYITIYQAFVINKMYICEYTKRDMYKILYLKYVEFELNKPCWNF